MRKDIVDRLIALRKKRGMCAKDVSLAIGKNKYYISKMEKGIFFPSFKELEALLGFYKSSVEELFYKEFTDFHFDMDLIEKFKAIGKKQKDLVLGMLLLAYENRDKEE